MQLRDGKLSLSPSDVTAYLACEHLTNLSLQVARGELVAPPFENDQAELIFRKGDEHERAYLQRLKDEGRQVVDLSSEPVDWETGPLATEEAMRAGVEVIYQAALLGEGWRGVADFLLRTDSPSDLGPFSYEALDTKLARHAKPAYILQLCFYSERIAAIQGTEPAHIHVLLGNLTQETFKPEEFGAYYRRVCRRLEDFVADPPPTEPYPVDRCSICEFRAALRRVLAGRRPPHRRGRDPPPPGREPPAAGIGTLAALGAAPADPVPHGIPEDTFEKLRQQAASSCTCARPARTSTSSSSRAPSRASPSSPTRRRATSSSTSRATRSGTRRARSSTSGGSSTPTAATSRSSPPPARRSAPRSSSSSTSCTSGSPPTRRCTSTTTPPTRSPSCAG